MKHLSLQLLVVFSAALFPLISTAQLACPSVGAGADQTSCPGDPVTLTATPVATGQATGYTASPTTYAPYPFNGGNQVIVNVDDVWTQAYNIGFNFCFYGQNYSSLVIGSNGIISFDLGNAGGFCPYTIPGGIPSAANMPGNSIACPFHDIDPGVGGFVQFNTFGAAPCRVFVISWTSIPYFSCNNITGTQQIALFETTNIIETYIANKPICTGWNGGLAIHGLQNAGGTVATTVPGRNATQWTAANDAWRFTPNGAPNFTLTWLQGGTPIGNGPTITVSPVIPTSYTVEMVYTSCVGTTVTVQDQVSVSPIPLTATATNTGPYCTGALIQLGATLSIGSGTPIFNWAGPNGYGSNQQNPIIPNATVANAGTYSVTATLNGCTASATTQVVVNANPSVGILGSTTFCTGQSTTLTATGATSFTWSNGTTNPQLIVTTPGVYSVTGTVAGGCTGSATVNVTAQPCNEICNNGLDDDFDNLIDCADPDCAATATASNTGPYCEGASVQLQGGPGGTFQWSGPNGFSAANQNPTINSADANDSGQYSVTVTNVSGCTASATTSVTVDALPVVGITGIDVFCAGTNSTLTASGANSYIWTTGANTASIVVTNTGLYSVTGTGAGGCTASASLNVIVNPLPSVSILGAGTFCAGQSTTLTGIGASSYLWSTGEATATITVNAPATYVVTGTDNNGCSATASLAVSQQACTEICNNGLDDDLDNLIDCADPDCAAAVTASNTGPYCIGDAVALTATGTGTYLWSGPNGFSSPAQTPFINNGQPTDSGPYAVTLTNAQGCTASASTVVTVNPVPPLVIAGNGQFCAGNNALLTASGGSTYVWATGETTAAITVTTSGTFVVTASDATGCTAVASFTVIVDPVPVVSIGGNTTICNGAVTALTASGATDFVWSTGDTSPSINIAAGGTYSVTGTNPGGCSASATINVVQAAAATVTATTNAPLLCTRGNLDLQLNAVIQGGTPPYLIDWTGPNGFYSPNQNAVVPNAGAIDAGTYVIVVTDANGCTTAPLGIVAAITEAPALPVMSSNGPVCSGQTLDLNAQAQPGVAYAWSGPNGFTNNTASPTILNVNAGNGGNYVVTVTNALGCTTSASIAVAILTNPLLSLSYNAPLTCTDGSADLLLSAAAVGGIPPYVFLWSGPNGFVSTQANASIPNATALNGGTYVVSASTASGCTAQATLVVDITDAPGAPILSSNSPVCTGETLTLTGQAVAGVTYAWSGPNGFTQNTPSGNLPNVTLANAGTYTLVVTNASGCSDSASIAVDINESPVVAPSYNAPLTCANGTGDLLLSAGAVGGAAPLSYAWSGPNGFTSAQQNPTIPNINAAQSGTYTVTVTTGEGCVAIASVVVDITDAPGAPILSSNSPLCTGETLTLTGQAVAGVTYAWSGPNGFAQNTPSGNLPNVTLANAGTYTLVVTNASGCSDSASIAVDINESPVVTPSYNAPLTCANGTGDLLLSAGAVGGAAPLSFAWSGPNGFASAQQNPTIPNINATQSGTYTVTVVTGEGCVAIASVVVEITDAPNAPVITGTPNACAGGTAVLNVPAQVGAQFQWLLDGQVIPGATSPQLTISPAGAANAGNYTVSVTLNGCTVTTAPFALAVSSGLTITAANDGVTCMGPTDNVNLTATVTGGTGPFNYQWNGIGQNGYVFQTIAQNPVLANVLNDFSGTYVVVVTDAYGCTALDSTVVDITVAPLAPVLFSNAPICSGNDLLLGTNPVGGGATYNWYFNGTLAGTTNVPEWTVTAATAANAGAYSAQLNDNGCLSPLSPVINVSINVSPTATATVNGPICAGGDLQFDAPFNPLWTYSWSGPAGFASTARSPFIANASAANSGDYFLVITNTQNGCFTVVTVTATVNALPTTPLIGNDGPICLGGDLSLFVAAGATAGATYTWYNANTNLSVATTNAANGLVTIGGLTEGSYAYYVIASDANGCQSEPSAATFATVNASLAITAFAGNDGYACDIDSANLSASLAAGAQGVWTTFGSATIDAPSDPLSGVNDLEPGANVFVWTVTIGTCVGSDSDTVIIWRESPPTANPDSFYTNLNQSLVFADIFGNDDLGGLAAPVVTFVENPGHGTALYNNDGTFTYQPDQGYFGLDSFVYQVCSPYCASLCDTALVEVQVGAFDDCHIPNVITPNNDGTNDMLFIPCLDVFGDNALRIFNRWGDEVFFAQPYLNNWMGTFSGNDLPEGTYFYVLSYTDLDGIFVEQNGYFMIHR